MPIMSSLGAMTYVKGAARVQFPPNVGTFIYCGFYAGVVSETATQYTFLIVSDKNIANATGFANWTTANTNCNNLVAYSCSDWRLPNRNELPIMCSTKTQFAAIGQGYNTVPNTASSVYWTRTLVSGSGFFYYTNLFWNCQEYEAANYDFVSYRAVRTQVVNKF